MEKVYIVAIELFLLESLLYFVDLNFLVEITIFFLIVFFIILKRREVSFYIFPIVFLIRIIFFINFSTINKGDKIYFKTNVINEYGKLINLNNKLYFKNKYVSLERIEDGEYNILGQVTKVNKNLLEVKILKKEKLEGTKTTKYLNMKIKNVKNYISNGCYNLLRGVILGESRSISREIKEMFRYSGGAHLLAISGLHIGIIIGLLTCMFGFLELEKQIKNIMIFIILTIYVFSIKISPSIFRAYIMGSVYIASIIFYEKVDINKSLALSFIITLILYPNSFSNISFLMSYISVFSIINIYPKIKLYKKFKGVALVNIFVFLLMLQIMLIPLTIYFFKTMAILAFIPNIVLTFLGSFFILFGFISLLLPNFLLQFGGGWFLEQIYKLLDIILIILRKIPWLSININFKITVMDIIFIYFIIVLIFFYKEINFFIKDTFLINLKNQERM
ncbi:MAG: ComEC/Rec2 family competence protein [Fusobacterium sp. JB019]|nr:ComEC/Rec2 family competence protein [Fusobacterium sp. JB019]